MNQVPLDGRQTANCARPKPRYPQARNIAVQPPLGLRQDGAGLLILDISGAVGGPPNGQLRATVAIEVRCHGRVAIQSPLDLAQKVAGLGVLRIPDLVR